MTGLGKRAFGAARSVGAVLVAALTLGSAPGCADESLGVGPYEQNPGQPYLPIGLTRVPALDPNADGGEDDLLLVGSTNLDQRFNAGTLDAYSLSELDTLIQCQIEQQNPGLGCAESSTTAAGRCAPAMIRRLTYSPEDIARGIDPCAREFEGVAFPIWKAGVLTLAGGGPIATMEIENDDPRIGGTYVVVPTRFDQSLTFVRVNTESDRAPNGLATTDYARGTREARDAPDDARYRPEIEPGPGGPYLACRQDLGASTEGVTSCTQTYSFPLLWDDPFSVSFERDAPGGGRLLVGHLTPISGGTLGVVTVLREGDLAARFGAAFGAFELPATLIPDRGSDRSSPSDRRTAMTVVDPPFAPVAGVQRLDSVSFLSATSILTTRVEGDAGSGEAVLPGLFVATNRRLDQALNVVGLSRARLQSAVDDFAEETATVTSTSPLQVELDLDRRLANVDTARPEIAVDLTDFTFGFTNRGIAYVPPSTPGGEGRLWVVTRIQEQVDSDASAIVTLAHDPTPEPGESELRVLSTFPLGEEIATIALSPFAPAGRRWMYALDMRSDQIFALDVTDRRPVILSRIRGRFEQPGALDGSDERSRLRFTLASPLEVVFDRRNGRRRMYVTNFENSTLAVIDVTADDPTLHRLVARLGVDRNTAGFQEGRDDFFRAER
jgi:hypothetical protein